MAARGEQTRKPVIPNGRIVRNLLFESWFEDCLMQKNRFADLSFRRNLLLTLASTHTGAKADLHAMTVLEHSG